MISRRSRSIARKVVFVTFRSPLLLTSATALLLLAAACSPAPVPTRAVVYGAAAERGADGAATGVVRLGVGIFDEVDAPLAATRISALDVDVPGASASLCTTAAASSGRLATVLMLDETGSLAERDPSGERFASVRAFVQGMRPNEVAAVARFSSAANRSDGLRTAEVLTPFTREATALLEGIAAAPLSSGTGALFDAAHDAVTLLGARNEARKVGVIVVDGADIGSVATAAAANAHARANGVALHAFGFGDAVIAELDALIAGTGGYRTVIRAGDARGVADLLDGLRDALSGGICVQIALDTAPAAGAQIAGTLTFTVDSTAILSTPFDVRF
jgi:hypothetical protein